MRKFWRDVFTEDDNQTYCIGRVCGFSMVFGYLGATFFHIFHGSPIDFSQLGLGCAAVLGGAGAFIGIKAATQKDS